MLKIWLLVIFCGVMMAQEKEIVAYFPEWGVEHQPYYIKHIEEAGSAEKITVINYAFAYPDKNEAGDYVPHLMNPYHTYQQVYDEEMSIDGMADSTTQKLRGQFNQLRKLKKRHPHLRVVISLGGWLGSKYFSDAALTEESRAKFVDATIDLFIKGNLPFENNAGGTGVAAGIFDGIDIDWEFPIADGVEGISHNENDKKNLTSLFKLFREKLDEINPDFLLTAAVPARESQLDNFNLREDQNYLDWILLMTYDFSGSWDKRASHHANMYSAAADSGYFGSPNSFDAAIKLLQDKYGIAKNKIIPGVAFYGRGWVITSPEKDGLFELGTVAPGTYENGFNYYCHLPLEDDKYTYYWDDRTMAPYLFSKETKEFWTFDDPQTIALKSRYVDEHGLRGVMFWEISGDDKNGTLVEALYSAQMPSPDYSTLPVSKDIYLEFQSPLTPGEDIKISVSVPNKDNVIKSDLYIDSNFIESDNTAPFNHVWFKAESGSHNLRVLITNKTGMVTSSEIITVKL